MTAPDPTTVDVCGGIDCGMPAARSGTGGGAGAAGGIAACGGGCDGEGEKPVRSQSSGIAEPPPPPELVDEPCSSKSPMGPEGIKESAVAGE